METTRQKKISRLIQKELSSIFQKELPIQMGNNVLSTVTIVRVSQDLANANVHTGYDDGRYGTYIGGSASANMSTYNYNSQNSSGGLYWWVK